MNFQSNKELTPHPVEAVFAKVSDLRHMEKVANVLDNAKVDLKVVDADRCELSIPMAGSVAFKVVRRTPSTEVFYEIEHSMLPAQMRITLSPADDAGSSFLQLSADVELNPFIAGMVKSRLADGIVKAAQMLSKIDYSQE